MVLMTTIGSVGSLPVRLTIARKAFKKVSQPVVQPSVLLAKRIQQPAPMLQCCPHHRMIRRRLRDCIRNLEITRRRSRGTQQEFSTRSSATQATRTLSSLYSDTVPPTLEQSQASSHFFRIHQPRKQWVATEWRHDGQPRPSQAESTGSVLVPEVAFLGRSNAGKSSLLNALLQSPLLCRVGPKPGKTTAMHAWTLCLSDPITGGAVKGQKGDMDPKLTVLDMPGYGHGSRTEWGQEIVTYLKRRKQLRRAMILINPLHGIKGGDDMILQLLRAHGIVHQIVASKCEATKPKELETLLLRLRDQIREGERQQGVPRLCLDDILAVGGLGDGKMNKNLKESHMLGVDDVSWTVLRACGLDEYAVHKYQAEGQRKSK